MAFRYRGAWACKVIRVYPPLAASDNLADGVGEEAAVFRHLGDDFGLKIRQACRRSRASSEARFLVFVIDGPGKASSGSERSPNSAPGTG
ncbi:protein of unknown function [Methylocaldum szegediense]|uniref:Uncharacterized protein n=1 Tax=Methylocaldum szegediense TaxID=73780 RepID=A0ABM9I281_9GAMM|nr:protein of unknown function [Methylocaldum szegediense]